MKKFHPASDASRAAALGVLLCAFLSPLRSEQAVTGRLSFTKVLAGSVPEYIFITLDTSGHGTFDGRKISEAPRPRAFQLSPATTERVFNLVRQLNYFRDLNLESGKPVANLGEKSLIYAGPQGENKVVFNYTQNSAAQALQQLLERIATAQQHVAALEFALQYDRLALANQLRQLQRDLDNQAIADPQQLISTLEQIANNPRLLHLAQSRARLILERLHSHP